MILMDDPTLIGVQIRQRRKYRGLSLDALAGLCGLSKSYLSMVENGSRTIGRRSHLVRLAEVLHCSTDELQGGPRSLDDPVHQVATAAVPAVREALICLHLGARPEPTRSIAELQADLAVLGTLRQRSEYADINRMMPSLLLDFAGWLNDPDPATREHAGCGFTDAAIASAFTLRHLGFGDLALRAADLAHATASEVGDPAWIGAAEFARLGVLPPESRGLAGNLAARAADKLEDQLGDAEDTRALHAYGMLHLSAAMTAAIASNATRADDHLVTAKEAARGIQSGDNFAHMGFCETNVGFWQVAIAVELGHPGRALEIARTVTPGRMPSRSRRAAYYADLGKALSLTRKHDEQAVAMIARAERLAPQRIRASLQVRETVADILRKARRQAGGKDLRDLARRVGVA